MPRYYCDYCDTYLTHDSPSVRKQHNAGYKHKANVRTYYQQFEEQQTQLLIDQRIKEHLGQAAAFQVGAAYNQHLMSQRPRMSLLPTPGIPQPPYPMNPQMMGMRHLPMFQRPSGPPGSYVMPPMMAAPGSLPIPQLNGLPRPPTLAPPTVPGTASIPSPSGGPPPMVMPGMYQANLPAPPTSGGPDNYNTNATSPESDD